MPVVFDSESHAQQTGAGSLSFTHTPVGTLSAASIEFAIYITNAGVPDGTVTYGGSPATFAVKSTNSAGNAGVVIHGIGGPPSGAQTVNIVGDANTVYIWAGCKGVTGSDTATVFSDSDASVAAFDVTLSTAAGELVTDVVVSGAAPTPDASQDQRYAQFLDYHHRGSTKSAVGSSTQMLWSGAAFPCIAAASFKESAGGGGHTVTINQATETNTAQSVTSAKRKTLGQTSETDLAQTFTHAKRKTLGQSTETDTAQAVTRGGVVVTLGQSSETDTAQAIDWNPMRRLIAQVVEIDLAQPIQHLKRKALGQASETDAAQTVTRGGVVRNLGQASETDTAQTFTHSKVKAVGQSSETDTAQPVSRTGRVISVEMAAETNTAQAVSRMKRIALGQASETDIAQEVEVSGGVEPIVDIPPTTLFIPGARAVFHPRHP